MMEQSIRHLATADYVRFSADDSVAKAIQKMTEAQVSEAYIISGNNYFEGKVSLHGLLTSPTDLAVTSAIIKNPISIKHDASLQQGIEIASEFVGESIPVVNRETNEMLGILSEADLFQAYLATQNKIIDLEKK